MHNAIAEKKRSYRTDVCIMLGGFIAANFCAFPAVFISIAAGVAVDGFFYVLKDRFLKAYRKKGKT